MKCVVFAYHDIGCEGLRALKDLDQEICAVFTHEDDPGENVWFGSVKKVAQEMGVPVYTPEDPNSSEWIKKIKELKPDILFSFYYRKMICDCILAIAPLGGLNLHGSLLPKYRGRAPINWVLVKGEKETGLTLHYMVKKPDAGDIVAQRHTEISDDDTALTLYQKLVPLAGGILFESVPLLETGAAPRMPQDDSKATYFGGRKPEDGRIDWTRPSKEIYNLVRAVTHPYPGAFGFFQDGRKFLVWQALETNEGGNAPPGTVISIHPLRVACGQGVLELGRVQSETQEELPGPEWAKKSGLLTGQILGR